MSLSKLILPDSITNSSSAGTLAAGAGLVGAAAALAYLASVSAERRRWRKVGVVERLYVHPLKSGKLREVTSLVCEDIGPRAAVFRDRSFCLANQAGTHFVSSKEFPQLLLVDLVFSDGNLAFTAPGMDDLTVASEDLAFDPEKRADVRMLDVDIKTMFVGKKYDDFFNEFLNCGDGNGVRLVYQCTEPGSFSRPARPKYMATWSDTFPSTSVPAFSYMTPYTLLTTASVDDLNTKLPEGKKKVTAEWFRPNILIRTEEGRAYQEDEWKGKIRFGNSAVLSYNKPCNRCSVITCDPDTGVRDPDQEPLRTLRSYRLVDPAGGEHDAAVRKCVGESPMFMTNCMLAKEGLVEVGDEVWAEME